MKIRIEKDIVEIIPENPVETTELEALWIKMGNCAGGDKKLAPLGNYMPSEDNSAKFLIEGLSEGEKGDNPTVLAPYDTDVYCVTCNKTQHVKQGEPIPVCCGHLMEIMD